MARYERVVLYLSLQNEKLSMRFSASPTLPVVDAEMERRSFAPCFVSLLSELLPLFSKNAFVDFEE